CTLVSSDVDSSSLVIRHCSLVQWGAPATSSPARHLEIANSQVISSGGPAVSWMSPGESVRIDHSVLLGPNPLVFHVSNQPFDRVSLRVNHSTLLGANWFCKVVWWDDGHPFDPKAPSEVLVHATGSVIQWGGGLLDLERRDAQRKTLGLSTQ